MGRAKQRHNTVKEYDYDNGFFIRKYTKRRLFPIRINNITVRYIFAAWVPSKQL